MGWLSSGSAPVSGADISQVVLPARQVLPAQRLKACAYVAWPSAAQLGAGDRSSRLRRSCAKSSTPPMLVAAAPAVGKPLSEG